MSLKIIKAGIQDTIQDLGRYGFRHLGINPTGAMDKFALQAANLLAGNHPGEAVIELHFPASVFLFTEPALIALGGADFSPRINGVAVPHLHAIIAGKNDLLQFHQPVKGARAYLAIGGGLALHPWLNSYSTNLRAGAGGLSGRILQKGDELFFRQPSSFSLVQNNLTVLPWYAGSGYLPRTEEVNKDREELFVLPGNEWERLTPGSKEDFVTTPFTIMPESDRMGYRLKNLPLKSMSREELVSSAVSFGTIQLMPDGSLIVLMADHQTTGGYPRLAHVITAHHSKLAQMNPGKEMMFRFTDQQTAEELLINQQQHLLQLQNACTFRLQEYFNDVAG